MNKKAFEEAKRLWPLPENYTDEQVDEMEGLWGIFSQGAEWKNKQFPSDALALIKQVPQAMVDAAQGLTDYDFLQEVNDFIKSNPSGAALQPGVNERMVKALEQVSEFSTGKLGSKYLGCIIADCNAALEEYYKTDTPISRSAAQPTGPVWVKCSVKMPTYPGDPNNHWRLDGFHKVNGNFFDEDGEIKFGVHGNGAHDDYVITRDKFQGIEWLDESNSQQLFTWEQVEAAFRAGVIRGDANCEMGGESRTPNLQEYMDTNYPPLNPEVNGK